MCVRAAAPSTTRALGPFLIQDYSGGLDHLDEHGLGVAHTQLRFGSYTSLDAIGQVSWVGWGRPFGRLSGLNAAPSGSGAAPSLVIASHVTSRSLA